MYIFFNLKAYSRYLNSCTFIHCRYFVFQVVRLQALWHSDRGYKNSSVQGAVERGEYNPKEIMQIYIAKIYICGI